MSGVIPDRVRNWFELWQENVSHDNDRAYIEISDKQEKNEIFSRQLATSWAFCLARELGLTELAEQLRNSLINEALEGFKLDPLLSGLYLLGDTLQPGSFQRLVTGDM